MLSETEKVRGWCTALSWLDQEPHDCSNTILLCILGNESEAQRSIESLWYSWVITLPMRNPQRRAKPSLDTPMVSEIKAGIG